MSEVEKPVDSARKVEPARVLDADKPKTGLPSRNGVGSRGVQIRRLQRGLGNAAFARLMTARQSAARPRLALSEHIVSNLSAQTALQEPAAEEPAYGTAVSLLRPVSAATEPPPPDQPDEFGDGATVVRVDGDGALPPDDPDEIADGSATPPDGSATAGAPPPDEAASHGLVAQAEAIGDLGDETADAPQGAHIARTPSNDAAQLDVGTHQGPGTLARQAPGGIPALRGPMPGGLTGIDKIREINKGGVLNWTGPLDENDLEEEWSKLGPSGAKQYEDDFMMSIKRGMEPDNLKGSEDAVESFKNAVTFLRDEYLRGNLKDIDKEEKKLGINEEKPSEANEAAMTELVVLAEKAKTLDEIIKKYGLIQVGYNEEMVQDEYLDLDAPGSSSHLEYRPAYFSPGSPPQKGLNGSEGQGAKPYEEVLANYSESMGALMAVANKHPSIYLALKSGQMDSIAGKDGAPAEDPKAAIKLIYSNARKAIQETQADPPDWDELKPIHSQLFRGEKTSGGISFKDPWYREIAKDEVGWSETKETLADIGIGLAAAIAFIFSEIATGGMATVLWAGAGLAIGGANVARKYDNYDQLKTAAAAGTSQATELIEKDQVNAALLDLVIEAAFFFIDAVGVGVKGIKGLAGLGVKKAGAQAAEKVGVAALKGVKSMGAIEAAETLTKGINELGVKRAAEAAGMSLDDLLSKVGEHTAAGARIREYMKLAKAGGVESAKLPAALKTVISGGEVLSETGAKLTAEQVAKQALEELGPQAALKAAGDWKTLANALGPTSEAAKGFTAWRKAVYGDLRNYIKSLAKEGETVDDLIKETGTLDNMTNDLDISLLGAKSSEHKDMAAQFLAGRTGLSPNPAALDKMVYIGLFTDPRRMHLFDEFPELQAKLAKRTMKFEEELIWNDEYAKYLAKGNKGDKAAAKLAEEIGQEMDALGVNKIPGFRPLSDRAAAVLSKNQDQLHEAILAAHKAGDMGKVESLIEELSNIQAQINVKEGGGYFSSGGVKKFVTEKEGFGGATRAAATAAQDLGAATDQVNKLRKAIQAFESAALVPPASRDISELAKHIKDLSKYGDRFAEAASVIGKPDGSALATMADEFSQILLQARGATVHTLQETLAKNMEGVIAKVRGVIKVYDDAHLEIIKALRERAAIDAVKDVAAPAIIDATRRRYAYLTFSSALIAQMDAAARAVGIPLQQLLGPEGEGGGGAPAAKPEEDEGPKGDFPITATNNGSVATSRIDRQPAPPEPSRLSAAPLQGANGSQEPHTSLDRSRIHAPDSVEPPLQRVARIDGNVGGGIVARGVMGSVFGPIPMPWAKTGIDKIRDILSDWWVGPFAESDLEDEWSKLGPSGAKQYEKEFMQSIDRGMEPDNLKGSGEVVESFENAVAFLRDEYLRGNLRDIEKEEKKLGINEEKPSEANEAAMTELKLIAEKAKTLNEILKKYSEIQVGYKKLFTSSGDRGPGGGAVGEWEWYPAYFWPGSPPQKALSGTEGAGSKPYDEVMASYTESRGALMAVASQHPAVYLALKSGQLDSIAGKDGLEPEDPKSAIKVLYGNARKAIEETQADPPDWDELKPIHGQLLRGEKGFMGIPFKDPWYREIVKDEIDWSETKDTLADLGIGLAAAIAFIFSEIATGGAATVIWAGVGLGIGGANVARKWDNYNELKNAAAAGTSEATELVSQDQVNAAFLDAVIESAFSFIDVVGIGIKGVKGVAGMAVKKAGAEALEKAAGTAALRGLKSMGGEEAAEAAAKGIKELGVKRAADEAGMSVEDLLAKVGKESAVGQQIEAYLKLAKEGVEPAKLPGAVKAVVEGGEVVGQNGVKMSAEEVIKQAVDTLGFQRTLKEAGSWKDLASALGASSEVGKRFKGWRDGVFADLENFIKGLRQADDEATEELIQKTGTLDNMTNDLDISFLGKHASENKEAATKYLAARTGLGGDANTLDKMVYIGLFTDPRRMHFFDMEKFSGLQQQLVKKTLAVQEQLIWNDEYYQWLLKAADGKTGAKEMAEKIAAEMDALGVVKMKGYKPLSGISTVYSPLRRVSKASRFP